MKAKRAHSSVKDSSGIVDLLVDDLTKKGVVRLVHFGRFKVISVKGRKVYSHKERKMVPVPEFKQVVFTPAKGLREMLNRKGG